MKNFKNILASIILLTFPAADAKQVGKKTTATPMPITQPVPSRTQKTTSSITQPTREKTFAQLYNEVKNARNAWDSKTQLLSDAFVTNLINNAQAAHINKQQLIFLFKLARDCHAQFMGSKSDFDILTNLTNQESEAIENFKKNLAS
jgi:hypothetical protein